MVKDNLKISFIHLQMVKVKEIEHYRKQCKSPKDLVELVNMILPNPDREYVLVFCMDTKGQPNYIEVVSIGTINASIVEPREVFKSALLSNSVSIILIHTHPSGNPYPSLNDIHVTNRIKKAADIIGIPIIDHIIVAEDQYYSFHENKRELLSS